MLSLRTRLLLAASIVLLLFVGLCGAGLEKAFHESALASQRERMQGLVYALLGAADPDEAGVLTVREQDVPEARLQQPQSGLEAALLDETGKVLWQSPSSTGQPPVVVGAGIGDWHFERLGLTNRFALSFGLRWIDEDRQPKRYTVALFESPGAYEAQLAVFRRTLWLWLAAAATGLIAALLFVQQWGLAPLRRLTGELRDVETGERPKIESEYPRELEPLTGALNAMIRNERNQQTRYRNALGDLAHSLKTPLAVLRGIDPSSVAGPARTTLSEQTSRMQAIVDHQLARAAAAGTRALAGRVDVRPIADKLVAAMKKVYADKSLQIDLHIEHGLQVRADAGDLYELIGNPLDNAAKWGKRRIAVRCHHENGMLTLETQDDGGGFPDSADAMLGRGVRADDRTPGQGLGLAATNEIVRAYGGSIELTRSQQLGGARVVIRIPG